MKLSVLIFLIPILFVCCTQVEQSCSSNEIELYEQLFIERKINRIAVNPDTIYLNELKRFSSDNHEKIDYNYCKYSNNRKAFTDYWEKKSQLLAEKDVTRLYNTQDSLNEKTAYYTISHPMFNSTFTKALIKITYEFGKYSSYREFSQYEKQSNKWILSKKISKITW